MRNLNGIGLVVYNCHNENLLCVVSSILEFISHRVQIISVRQQVLYSFLYFCFLKISFLTMISMRRCVAQQGPAIGVVKPGGHVGEDIAAKCQAFKAWKSGKGTRASYHAAKRIARHAVHHACQEADKEVYKNTD